MSDDRSSIGLPSVGAALSAVAERGWARVVDVLDPGQAEELITEVDPDTMTPVPELVGQVRQRATELDVPVGDPAYPQTTALAGALRRAVAREADGIAGVEDYAPNEASYMRYVGSDAGITPHRDRSRHRILVAVFTLRGAARFAIVADRAGTRTLAEWVTGPGDLCLLRAPGLGGCADGRPLHAVGGPAGDDRVSLALRMNSRRFSDPDG